MDLLDRLLNGREASAKREGRPWITLSYAQSLDGSIAAYRDRPMPLSCPETLRLTHQLRASHRAILVGIGTVLADDPRLTVRMVDGEDPQPIVLDSRLRIPRRAVLLRSPGLSPWVFTTKKADEARQADLEAAGARVFRLPSDQDGHVDLYAMMQHLDDLGVESLMVEGGAQVITAFIADGWVDRLIISVAPVLVGGQRAVERLLLPERERGVPASSDMLSALPRLRDVESAQLGTDVVIWGTPCAEPV